MSEQGIKPEMKIVVDYAVTFTNAKGRMPWDVHELRAWLREYAMFETRRADALYDMLVEHMMTALPPPIVVEKS